MMLYIGRRVLGMVPTLLCIVVLSFLLVRLSPGSPFTGDRALDPAVRAALDAKYGLDRPILQQLIRYIWTLAHGDLGPSIRYPQHSVGALIAQGLPHTLVLGCAALAWGLCLGLALGIGGTLATLYRWPLGARITTLLATLALSLPSFVLGPLLVLGTAVYRPWLPPAGWGELRHIVLPALTLGTLLAASIARLTQGGLADVLKADFVRTARAKGLPPHRILWRHMLLPGLMPLVTYLGPAASSLLVGSVAVERIFCVPGIGPYFVDAALNRDYFLVMGIVILASVLLLLSNLMVDVMYAWLDPRVRLGAN